MKITEREFIEKGMRLFKEKGYQNVSVMEICEQCHVTKGSFYHHFKSKKDILDKFYETVFDNPMDLVETLVTCKSYKEKLWAILEYGINSTIEIGAPLLKDLLLLNIMPNYGIQDRKYEKNGTDDVTQLILTMIQNAKDEGEILNPNTAEDLWFNYQNALYGIALHWSVSGADFDEKEELKRLFEIIFY